MTREKIISLARECSKPDTVDCYHNDYFTLDLDELEAFYQRVRNETLAAQAVVIEKLRGALYMATSQNEHDMLMTGDELRQCNKALAIPTDSKQILAEWLDSVLGEPRCYIHPDSFNLALRRVNVGSAYRLPDKDREPLFKKPEILK